MITTKSLVGLLMVCCTFAATCAETPKLPKPVSTKIIMLTILEYKTLDEIKQACAPDEPTARPQACTWRDKRGQATIAVLRPKDWCDWMNLKTWGHELLHAYGLTHGEAFKQYFSPDAAWPMWGENCELEVWK